MREQIEEKIAQWVYDLERTPHYPYLDKIVTDKDVEKLCEVVEKMLNAPREFSRSTERDRCG